MKAGLVALALTLLVAPCAGAALDAGSSRIAEAIYRNGLLPSGAPLRGERAGAFPVQGMDAACASCHGRSGMGSVEGSIVIPPIAGRVLRRPGVRGYGKADLHDHASHPLAPTPRNRKAYDDASLARVIREGVDPDGRELDYLMPRFTIDNASMQALISYLNHLSGGHVPGLLDGTLQLATIIASDADPVEREGMLTVLDQFVRERNERRSGSSPVMLQAHADSSANRDPRRWVLNVWELHGDAQTWERQLEDFFARGPVFAVISGLGRSTWEPVERFCARHAVPCLLPNVDLPGKGAGDPYTIHFSQGVLLEARLIAARLTGPSRAAGTRRVVQFYRSGDVGESAAAQLREALAGAVPVLDGRLPASSDGDGIDRAMDSLMPGDALVMWLRPDDLAKLPTPRDHLRSVFLSGLMAGLEAAPLAPAWRERVLMAYPLALPEERRSFLNYPLGWFHLNRIAVVAERVQVNTYVACATLSEAFVSMRNDDVPDYLLETIEASMESRLVNGYYRRLALGQDDHFASKGGYLVRFDGPEGSRVLADGTWMVP